MSTTPISVSGLGSFRCQFSGTSPEKTANEAASFLRALNLPPAFFKDGYLRFSQGTHPRSTHLRCYFEPAAIPNLLITFNLQGCSTTFIRFFGRLLHCLVELKLSPARATILSRDWQENFKRSRVRFSYRYENKVGMEAICTILFPDVDFPDGSQHMEEPAGPAAHHLCTQLSAPSDKRVTAPVHRKDLALQPLNPKALELWQPSHVASHSPPTGQHSNHNGIVTLPGRGPGAGYENITQQVEQPHFYPKHHAGPDETTHHRPNSHVQQFAGSAAEYMARCAEEPHFYPKHHAGPDY